MSGSRRELRVRDWLFGDDQGPLLAMSRASAGAGAVLCFAAGSPTSSGVRADFAASASLRSVTGVSDVDSDPAKVPVRIADDAAASSRKASPPAQQSVRRAAQATTSSWERSRHRSRWRSACRSRTRWKSRIRHDRLDSRRATDDLSASAFRPRMTVGIVDCLIVVGLRANARGVRSRGGSLGVLGKSVNTNCGYDPWGGRSSLLSRFLTRFAPGVARQERRPSATTPRKSAGRAPLFDRLDLHLGGTPRAHSRQRRPGPRSDRRGHRFGSISSARRRTAAAADAAPSAGPACVQLGEGRLIHELHVDLLRGWICSLPRRAGQQQSGLAKASVDAETGRPLKSALGCRSAEQP